MINHKNNFVWVNKYPLDQHDEEQIISFLNACVEERCKIEEELYDPNRVIISHSIPSESPFKVPEGDVAGVYWWEYSD